MAPRFGHMRHFKIEASESGARSQLVEFEYLVRSADDRSKLLFDLLGYSVACVADQRHFIVEESQKSIGIWQHFRNQSAMDKLQRLYPDLCVG